MTAVYLSRSLILRVLVATIFCGLSLFSSLVASSQPADIEVDPLSQKRIYTTAFTQNPPQIDGLISDKAWSTVKWSSAFTQREPVDGGQPTSETAFKVLYNDRYVFIAARCYDAEPDNIVKRMSRRDGFDGDWVEVNIDSYHDMRTAFSFTASVSGVKGDELVSRDGNDWDSSWNPIWNFKTSIDSAGWIAEIAIPLSQLRFDKSTEKIWGFQVTRRDFRNESRSNWQYIPQNSGYWVSGFGELHGLNNIKPKRQIEIQPYVVGKYETSEKIENHPFRDGSEANLSVGLDGKIGVTNDLTLDFTINPDFGQVEADPSALNLDGFEIFFEERRPFFVENRNLFNYNITSARGGGPFNGDNLFYSRRIGARPHVRIFDDPAQAIYVDQPDFSSILGAAKFSGKTKSGFSIGILESVTQDEYANVRTNNTEEKRPVEPLTNYNVLRLIQDFDEGNTVIGLIGTGVVRDIDDASLTFLHQKAFSGGMDVLHRWNDRRWQLNARFVGSRVSGSANAITRTQSSFGHGFGRPDADHIEIDSTATSLSGTGADLSIRRLGRRFQIQLGGTYRSPGLELNDIGFLRNADEINQYLWARYRWLEPVSIFRNLGFNFKQNSRWDFSGQSLYQSVSIDMFSNLKNFWSLGGGLTIEFNDVSNTWLRSGPSFRKPQGLGGFLNLGTDTRKKIRQNLNMNGGRSFDGSVYSLRVGTTTSIQASDGLSFSIGGSFNRAHREDQYITTLVSDDEKRYIVGEILRKTLSFTVRGNYNITPDLTLQYYGQPFISRGIYSDIKFVNQPLAQDVNERIPAFNSNQIIFNHELDGFEIDENENGIVDYTISNPNFDFVQFRSNLVLRWEYIPGSELFLVWSQGSSVFQNRVSGSIFDALDANLWNDSLVNTFLIKATYRFTN